MGRAGGASPASSPPRSPGGSRAPEQQVPTRARHSEAPRSAWAFPAGTAGCLQSANTWLGARGPSRLRPVTGRLRSERRAPGGGEGFLCVSNFTLRRSRAEERKCARGPIARPQPPRTERARRPRHHLESSGWADPERSAARPRPAPQKTPRPRRRPGEPGGARPSPPEHGALSLAPRPRTPRRAGPRTEPGLRERPVPTARTAGGKRPRTLRAAARRAPMALGG